MGGAVTRRTGRSTSTSVGGSVGLGGWRAHWRGGARPEVRPEVRQAAIDDGPRREDGDAPHRGPAPPTRQRVHLEDLSKEALCAHMRHSPTLGRLQGDAKPWNERQQLRELVRPRHQYNDREAGRCNILLVLEVAVSCDERDNTLGKNESQKSPVASTGPSALGNRLDVESEQFPLQWTRHTLVQQNTRR